MSRHRGTWRPWQEVYTTARPFIPITNVVMAAAVGLVVGLLMGLSWQTSLVFISLPITFVSVACIAMLRASERKENDDGQ